MIGSPNPGYFVYDDNPGRRIPSVTSSPPGTTPRGSPGSTSTRRAAATMPHSGPTGSPLLASTAVATRPRPAPTRRSGAARAGADFDACYHRSCDTIDNLDLTSLDRGADLIGAMTYRYSAGTSVVPRRHPPGATCCSTPASSPVRRTGPARPARSPTTAGRPARSPAAGRPGWVATARPRGRRSSRASRSRRPRQPRRCRSGCAPTPLSRAAPRTTRCCVQVASGSTTTTLATYSNVGADATYAQKSLNVTAYKGKTISGEVPDERGLVAADVLRRRRRLARHELTPQTGGR